MRIDFSDRISRGAALLDEHVPGWEDLVDTSNFDVASINHCVLGQIFTPRNEKALPKGVLDPFNSFSSGFGIGMNYFADKLGGANFVPGEYGFATMLQDYPERICLNDFIQPNPYDVLNKQWREFIKARRAQNVLDQTAEVVNAIDEDHAELISV